MFKELTLSELIESAKIGEVYKATYAMDQYWYITITEDTHFRYCSSDGTAYDNVPLTRSNLRAYYKKVCPTI